MSQPVTVTGGPNTEQDYRSGSTTLSLELDVLGEPVRFDLKVANVQARLSDIAPLARTLSAKLVGATLDRLGAEGKNVPCRKGCSACCRYLVPLSVPEVFRLAEDMSAMPASDRETSMQASLDTARIILDRMPADFRTAEPAQAEDGVRSKQLSEWYAGLGLSCPLLSDNLCVLYEQRPIACREHMVISSADSCDPASTHKQNVVKMPVSVIECLGLLTAELEQSDVEAVMLPLALPWAQENAERSRRTWPAPAMVERFVEILQSTAKAPAAAPQP